MTGQDDVNVETTSSPALETMRTFALGRKTLDFRRRKEHEEPRHSSTLYGYETQIFRVMIRDTRDDSSLSPTERDIVCLYALSEQAHQTIPTDCVVTTELGANVDPDHDTDPHAFQVWPSKTKTRWALLTIRDVVSITYQNPQGEETTLTIDDVPDLGAVYMECVVPSAMTTSGESMFWRP